MKMPSVTFFGRFEFPFPPRTFLLIFCSVVLNLSACGADYYVSQSGSGTQSGADSSDCIPLATQNATWHGGPGDTVHLVGTLTNTLSVGAGGAAGNPLTIYFEPNAQMVAGALGTFIKADLNNYLVIDGGLNGLIANTNNGVSLGNRISSTGVSAAACRFLMIKNLTIANLFVRTNNSTDSTSAFGVQSRWNGGATPTDVTVSNCVIHDAAIGFNIDYGPGATNFTMANCTISNCNWGGNAGDHNSTATLVGLTVINNRFSNWSPWEDPSDYNHHNGFYGWAESGGSLRNVKAYGNLVGPGFTGGHQTSGVFFSGDIGNVLVYNNLFTNGVNEVSADGDIFLWQHINNGTNIAAYNNTFLGAGGNGQAINIYQGTNGYVVKNNAVSSGFQSAIAYFYDNGRSIIDNNGAYGIAGNKDSANGSATSVSWSTWQALGYDLHGITNNPFLNPDGTLQTNSPLISAGANLSGVFTTDLAGYTRPPTGNWTIGAYQYAASSIPLTNGNLIISVSTSNLNFGIVGVGAVTNQIVTVHNSGSGTLTGSATVAPPFTIVSGGTYSLIAGQSQPIVVGYDPVAAGTNIQSLTFSNGPSVALSGTAVAPPAVSAITQNGADVDLTAPGLQIFAGSVVQYSATASDPNGLPLTWQWSYSVNGGSQTVVQSGTGAVGSVSYNYTASTAGNTYVWTLQANNGYATTTSTLTVGVEAPPPATNGLSFSASAAALTAPFVLTNDSFSQPVETVDPTQGGQAVFTFTITQSASYVVQALVDAPGDANNSFFINVDAQPVAPTMIWDIPLTSGFEQRIVSWRGSGTDTNNQYVPKVFSLSVGTHQLIIRGREAGVQLQSISLLNYLSPPTNLHVASQ